MGGDPDPCSDTSGENGQGFRRQRYHPAGVLALVQALVYLGHFGNRASVVKLVLDGIETGLTHQESQMKRLMLTAALLLATGALAGELKVELEGKGMAGNQVRVAVYSANAPEQYPSEDKYYRGVVYEATSDRLTVRIPDLPPGKYAVAAFVDSNRNGKQDKNFLGVPNEIYGFSNNARGTFGTPDFAEAAFDIGENDVIKPIHLH
jgi:uncharacterized protein (DUF2141 family)